MSNKILVTGATGNIGTALQAELADSDLDVVLGTHAQAPGAAGLPTRAIDFGDPDHLREALADVDTLFLLLPLAPREQLLEWTRNAIEAARSAGVSHVVRSSGIGADPGSPHALMAMQGELDALVREGAPAWTIVRPATFMQNFSTSMAGMVQGGALYLPQGEARTAFVDTRDVAAVVAAVLRAPEAHAGATLDVTGPAALDNAAVMAAIGAVLGRELQYVPVDDDTARAAMASEGLPGWLVDWLMSLHEATRDGVTEPVSDTVRRVAGREPHTIERFAADHADAWR